MNKLILLIFITVLFSCSKVGNESENENENINKDSPTIQLNLKDGYGIEVKVIQVDSCEYLYFCGQGRMGLSHKGNCKFCLEREKVK